MFDIYISRVHGSKYIYIYFPLATSLFLPLTPSLFSSFDTKNALYVVARENNLEKYVSHELAKLARTPRQHSTKTK